MAQHRQENEDAFQVVEAIGPLFHRKGHGKNLPSDVFKYSIVPKGIQGSRSHLTGAIIFPII
jgi:hypothetical protein